MKFIINNVDGNVKCLTNEYPKLKELPIKLDKDSGHTSHEVCELK